MNLADFMQVQELGITAVIEAGGPGSGRHPYGMCEDCGKQPFNGDPQNRVGGRKLCTNCAKNARERKGEPYPYTGLPSGRKQDAGDLLWTGDHEPGFNNKVKK